MHLLAQRSSLVRDFFNQSAFLRGKLQNTVFVNGSPVPYGTLAPTWRDEEARLSSRWTTALWQNISSDRRPRSSFPRVTGLRTKCRGPHSAWTIVRTKGLKENHTFKCILLESKPRCVGATGGESTYEAELTAWHVRNALELQHGGHKTLDEMFGDKTRGLAGLATDRLRSAVRKASTKMPGVKIRRHESFITTGAAMMGMIWTAKHVTSMVSSLQECAPYLAVTMISRADV